jgi:hypothetical protein
MEQHDQRGAPQDYFRRRRSLRALLDMRERFLYADIHRGLFRSRVVRAAAAARGGEGHRGQEVLHAEEVAPHLDRPHHGSARGRANRESTRLAGVLVAL